MTVEQLREHLKTDAEVTDAAVRMLTDKKTKNFKGTGPRQEMPNLEDPSLRISIKQEELPQWG